MGAASDRVVREGSEEGAYMQWPGGSAISRMNKSSLK